MHGLRALGLQAGDGVAVVLPNSTEFYALFFAAMQAGWYFTPINHHLVGPEIAYIVDDCEAKALIGRRALRRARARSRRRRSRSPPTAGSRSATSTGFRPFAELIDGPADDRCPTTAPPARRCTTRRAPPASRRACARTLPGVDPDDAGALSPGFLLCCSASSPHDDNVHICGSPLYHTAVLLFAASSIHLGHPVVLMDKWTPEAMLELIERPQGHPQPHGADAVPPPARPARGGAGELRRVVAAPHDPRRRAVPAGDQAPDDRVVGRRDRRVLRGHRGRRHARHRRASGWSKPGTVGIRGRRARSASSTRTARTCPTGEHRHRLHAHGAAPSSSTSRTRTKTEANRQAGFFTVGDVGYLDDDGYLFLCDRKTDMIISGGVNIYPAEIEGVLLAHPKVGDAAVFGIPHEDWGEEIKAVVEPAAGVEPGDALDRRSCSRSAATTWPSSSCPKSIDFTNEMPRDPNGKLYKRKLRDPYWEGRERARSERSALRCGSTRTWTARSSSVITDSKSRRPLAQVIERRVPDVADARRGCRPAARASRSPQDVVAHQRDLPLHRGAALVHARVGRRERADERHRQLGLALHRLAGPVQHVDQLVGHGVALGR